MILRLSVPSIVTTVQVRQSSFCLRIYRIEIVRATVEWLPWLYVSEVSRRSLGRDSPDDQRPSSFGQLSRATTLLLSDWNEATTQVRVVPAEAD